MSSQNSANNDQSVKDNDKKRARRTRKDEDGRDYICSCGKSYLSYPALYTHIKTKHDGKAPQKINQEEDKPVMKEDLQQLKMFLNTKYYPQRLRATPLNLLAEVLSTQQKQYIIPHLFYWETQQKNEKANPTQKKCLVSAKQVFAKFIYDMNKRTNPACIKFLVKLIMQVHKGICAEKKNDKYCEECTASLVPSIFNQLIMNGHIAIDKNSPQKIMQDNEAVCKVLVYFCNWMFNQKYTNYSVKYKQ